MSQAQGLVTLLTRHQDPETLVAEVADRPFTRAEFLSDVAAWAHAMSRVSGTRIALYTDNSCEFAAALMGAWQADKVVVLPGDAQPQTVARLAANVDAMIGDLPQGLRPTAQDRSKPWPFKNLDLQCHRLVVQTSGSSGEPLDIDKRLHQLDAEVRTLESCFGPRLVGADLRVYATVSHQHIYGLLFQVLWPLSTGRVFISGRLDYPENILAALRGGPAVLVASPAHLKRLPDTLPWAKVCAQCLAIFSSGGPLLPDASYEAARLLGQSPIEVYGSSETGGIAWRQRAQHGDIWTPFAAVHLRQVDGLLGVASPNLPDDQYWVTSDKVRLHEDKRFELLGRADRIVKVEEKRVSLTVLEQGLLACPEVAEVRVLPLSESDRVRLAAVVVLTESGRQRLAAQGKRGLTDHLRQTVLQWVERVAVPRRWRFVEALPVNAQGKTTAALVQQLFKPLRPPLQWGEVSDTEARATLTMVPELAAFDGHFPTATLLPGVAQLDWAIALGRECFDLRGAFWRVDVLKFQVPILPGARVDLHLQWDAPKSTLSFVYQSQDVRHASGRVVFRAGEVCA